MITTIGDALCHIRVKGRSEREMHARERIGGRLSPSQERHPERGDK